MVTRRSHDAHTVVNSKYILTKREKKKEQRKNRGGMPPVVEGIGNSVRREYNCNQYDPNRKEPTETDAPWSTQL